MPAIVIAIRRLPVVLSLLLVLAAAAEASDLGLADHWKNPAIDRIGFHKIVVVGITHDAESRRRFEDRFVTLLRAREMQAITSYTLVPDLANVPDPEKVLKTILADQVDGVFTVRFAPLGDDDAEKAWPAAWRADVESPVPVREYVAETMKRPFAEVKIYGAEIAVWEVTGGRRLWAGRLHPMKRKELQKNAGALAQDVMNQLIFEKVF